MPGIGRPAVKFGAVAAEHGVGVLNAHPVGSFGDLILMPHQPIPEHEERAGIRRGDLHLHPEAIRDR